MGSVKCEDRAGTDCIFELHHSAMRHNVRKCSFGHAMTDLGLHCSQNYWALQNKMTFNKVPDKTSGFTHWSESSLFVHAMKKPVLMNWPILARLYESTGRAIALLPTSALALASASALALASASVADAAASALTKILKFYVKVFKTSYFLNPQMDLVYIWYSYRCWSKILFSPIHISAHDL